MGLNQVIDFNVRQKFKVMDIQGFSWLEVSIN
jgi:hypothetical protein